jgi:hypothetical protein
MFLPPELRINPDNFGSWLPPYNIGPNSVFSLTQFGDCLVVCAFFTFAGLGKTTADFPQITADTIKPVDRGGIGSGN